MDKTITVEEINEILIACKVDIQELHKEIQEKPVRYSRSKVKRLRIAINERLIMLEGLNQKEIDFRGGKNE